MSANIFFVSDTHFGHTATWQTFKRADGTPLRPFRSTAEMDETMISRWNAVVRPSDHVYHLGDVLFDRRHLPLLARLNGHKRLVRGNHDIFRTKFYLPYFREIHGVRVFADFIASHIPIHPDSLGRYRANVHGHLHANRLPDARYLCVSVEQTDYTPLSYEDCRARLRAHLAASTTTTTA